MKFKMSFKTPAVMNYSGPCTIYDDSPNAIAMRSCHQKFVGTTDDDITIEFDTETGTAILVPLQ